MCVFGRFVSWCGIGWFDCIVLFEVVCCVGVVFGLGVGCGVFVGVCVEFDVLWSLC